jgi:Sep15/SelM redox domain
VLNRLPVVKQFLKGGEAETYEGITIEWIRGSKPVLTIYEDGKKREEVQLEKYDNLDALHALMKEKGFHHKAGESGKFMTEVDLRNRIDGAAKIRQVESGKVPTTAKLAKERIQTKSLQGDGGDYMLEEDWTESGPVQGFGLFTGVVISGGALYYAAKNRKKNARNTV